MPCQVPAIAISQVLPYFEFSTIPAANLQTFPWKSLHGAGKFRIFAVTNIVEPFKTTFAYGLREK
jgi:hypothetical protein